jgi:cytochrome c oxidase assembly protein subunit 17
MNIHLIMDLNSNIEKEISKTENINKKKLKPCCACPETRDLRDKCIFEKGEEDCFKFIEDHKKCLKNLGFEV